MAMRWALAMALGCVVGCGDAVSTSGNSGTTADSGAAGTGGTSGNACNDVCAAQARAGCSAFQMGTCVSNCQAQLSAAPQCASVINAAIQCAAGATYTCNSSNRPTTMSCIAEGIMALQCATPDGGA